MRSCQGQTEDNHYNAAGTRRSAFSRTPHGAWTTVLHEFSISQSPSFPSCHKMITTPATAAHQSRPHPPHCLSGHHYCGIGLRAGPFCHKLSHLRWASRQGGLCRLGTPTGAATPWSIRMASMAARQHGNMADTLGLGKSTTSSV